MPDEAIAALRDRKKDAEMFQVFAENWPAVVAFLSVSTQWRAISRMDGSVYWQGLDYAGAERGFAMAGITIDPALWGEIRVMEAAARNRLNGMMESD